MDTWYIYAILATVSYGFFNFLYKVAAQHKLNSSSLVKISSGFVFIFSAVSIYIQKVDFFNTGLLIILAVSNSLLFFTASLSKLEALKNVPSYIAFPVAKFNATVAVILSLIIFSESPSITQWIGILCTIFIFMLLSDSKGGKEGMKKNMKLGIFLSLISAFATGITAIIGKFAALYVAKEYYMTISYLLVFMYSGISVQMETNNGKEPKDQKPDNKKLYLIGFLIGLLNFIGYYLLLSAYKTGNVSLIQPIFSTSIVIPIMLSTVFFKEKMNTKQLIAVILSIASLALLK